MTEADDAEWVTVATSDECPPGTAREFVLRGKVIAVFNVDGSFFAVDGVCAHQGGPLGQGELTDCIVTCPWHGWQFDVTNGINQITPQVRQRTYAVRTIDGQVQIAMPPGNEDQPTSAG